VSAAAIERASITGVVLAGGQGRRMGGVDKGLVELAGRPLVARVIERLAPQVGALLINANQNVERYAALGHAVVRDAVGGCPRRHPLHRPGPARAAQPRGLCRNCRKRIRSAPH
jgi:molybdopterin-guanine dinucleotide biosynthesis protein A